MSEAEIASSHVTADQNRDDLVDRLKADLAAKTEAAARVNARIEVFEAKERARITGWQADAKFFMSEFVKEEVEAHHPQLRDDVAVFTGDNGWAHTYHEKPEIAEHSALAAVTYVASKGIKRLREQASQGAQAATALAETMKTNEDLTAANAKLQKDCADYKILSDERQKGLEALQAELTRAGLCTQPFNFSKLTSREKEVAAPEEPHVCAATTPSLEVVKAEASKAATGAFMGNPVNREDVLQSLLRRSTGGLRMGPSGTNHAHLGAISGEPDIATILRSAM